MPDCHTPPGGIHHCQPLDDAEATIHELVNVAALERFANPRHLPLFPLHRRVAILKVWERAQRIPTQSSRHHAEIRRL